MSGAHDPRRRMNPGRSWLVGVPPMALIDLRSDTVTRPGPAMREAMARADVGDDVYGEDPTLNRLEEQVAALLGKEAAVFVPSGTMGNQIALLVHTRRGEEVILGEDAHMVADELGAAAAWSGVQFRAAGWGGRLLGGRAPRGDAGAGRALPHPEPRRRGEPAQPRRRARLRRARVRCDRGDRAREGARAAPRRRAPLERGGGDGGLRGGARGALRHGQRLLLQGPRRARGLGALGEPRRDREREALPQDARRRHAPGRRPRGGGALRARAPPGPPGGGPRARPHPRGRARARPPAARRACA